MTTNTITVVSKALTPEQKAARAKAAQARIEGLAKYLEEAKVIAAKQLGIANPEAMGNLMSIKSIAAKVYAAAEDLRDKAEGKPARVHEGASVGGTPKWIGKLKLQLQKAVGFAKKHKVSDDNLLNAFEFAVTNPIMETREKKSAEDPKATPETAQG